MANEFFVITPESWLACVSHCQDLLEDGATLKITVKDARKRSMSQNALQHVIYGEISKYLISKGREDWTPEFVKENLKNKFLGWEEREYIDVETGHKSIMSVLRHTSKLDVGESCDYTTKIIDWAESIGCKIKIPANSVYMEMMEKQNA